MGLLALSWAAWWGNRGAGAGQALPEIRVRGQCGHPMVGSCPAVTPGTGQSTGEGQGVGGGLGAWGPVHRASVLAALAVVLYARRRVGLWSAPLPFSSPWDTEVPPCLLRLWVSPEILKEEVEAVTIVQTPPLVVVGVVGYAATPRACGASRPSSERISVTSAAPPSTRTGEDHSAEWWCGEVSQ